MSDITPQELAEAPRKGDRPKSPQQWIHRVISKYRHAKFQLAYRPDDAFFELADAVIPSKLTLLGYDRLYVLWQTVRNVAAVPGAVAEIGTFRGGSAFFIASALQTVADQAVPIHVFDTFEGHPEAAISEDDPFQTAGQFARTSLERVQKLLSAFPEVHLHKGDITTQLPLPEETAYRLVHIDVDLYPPMLSCLEYFGARMSPGGIIVVDDYASLKCPGVAKAVSEYLEDSAAYQVWDLRTEQLVLVKR
jgi:hypothetical protein